MDPRGSTDFKPTIVCGDLAKPPAALAPLIACRQWAIWRLTWRGRRWTKPPFQVCNPQQYASSADAATWSNFNSAVAAKLAGYADGVTYMLTPADSFAAVDIDHVRDPITGSIEPWAQRLLDQASRSYAEISPSGTGLRIWGTRSSGEPLHRKFALENGMALELFRRTRKPLTVTGLQLGNSKQFDNIDALLDRAVVWAQNQQRKSKITNGSSPNAGTMGQYSVDQIERMVQDGAPPGANRSDTFHGVVGHYLGCGWTAEQIYQHLAEHPDGIGNRYIAEGRLAGEVERSIRAFSGNQDSTSDDVWSSGRQPERKQQSEQQQSEQNPELDPELEPDPELGPDPELEPEPRLEPDPPPQLPPMYAHGDPDPRPVKSWTIKGLMPTQGHGLLSGQWGTFKSFVALELCALLMTGQPFLNRLVKRQCGVLFLAAEGQSEMRLRLEALVREKCGGMARAPFRWFEDVPLLLKPDGVDLLVTMAKAAAAALQQEFGLPLGLIVIDTVVASAGYTTPGAENDNAINQRLMNVLKLAAQQLDCFCLGVDHFGKDMASGTRGGSAKEASSDLVLACLGERELSGRIVNTRLAIRKCRGGRSGQEYPFGVREVEIGRDEDDEPITTLVIDWGAQPQSSAQPPRDPWAQSRQAETRQAMLLLKRIVLAKLAELGVQLPIEPPVRGIDRELVRTEFYVQTPVDGSERQKQFIRSKRFSRAIARAAEQQLIGVREIGTITYLWLMTPADNDF
jgi:hypothetical protein